MSDAGEFSAEVQDGVFPTEHFKVHSGETSTDRNDNPEDNKTDRIHGASSPFQQTDRIHGASSPLQQSDRIPGASSPLQQTDRINSDSPSTRKTVIGVERRSYPDGDSDEEEKSDEQITEAERERLLQETAEAFKKSEPPKASSPVSHSPFGVTTEENQVPVKPVVTQDPKGTGVGGKPPIPPRPHGSVEESVQLIEERMQDMLQK